MLNTYIWIILFFGGLLVLSYLIISKYLLKLFLYNKLSLRDKGKNSLASRNSDFFTIFILPVKNKLTQLTPQRIRNYLNKNLIASGTRSQLGDVLLLKVLSAILVGFFCFFFMHYLTCKPAFKLIITSLIASLVFIIPDFYLKYKAEKRKESILRSLPEFIDYLLISVEAGMGLDMAIYQVIKKMNGPLAEEMAYTMTEIQYGKSKKEAFKLLSSRVDIPDFSILLNALISSAQLGVSLGNILKIQGQQIREKRQQQVQEMAYKIPIKLLFPLIFFILPGLFLVLLGPALIRAFAIL